MTLLWVPQKPDWYNPEPGVWRLYGRPDVGVTNSRVSFLGVRAEQLYIPPSPGPDPEPDPEPEPDWRYVLNEDFSSWPLGTPTAAKWNTALGMGTGNDGTNTSQKCKVGQGSLDQYIRVVDGGGTRGNVLSFLLPKDSDSTNKGIQAICNLPNPQDFDEAILEYDIRFRGATPDLPFGPTWGYGGKLPGLGGVVKGTTSPSEPSGCKTPATTSWSNRMMWWGMGPNGRYPYSVISPRKNRAITYSYDYLRTDPCGDNLPWKTATSSTDSFRDQTWHTIREHCKLNTPGQANGVRIVTLDGVEVEADRTWQPRSRSDLHITHLWMQIFRGGNDSLWGVPKDTRIDIDRLRVSVPVTT